MPIERTKTPILAPNPAETTPSAILIKEGVIFKRFEHQIAAILPIIAQVFGKYGFDCVITSANDGKHKNGSKHYTNMAIDLRTYHLPSNLKEPIRKDIQTAIGDRYRILYEGEKTAIEAINGREVTVIKSGEHFHLGYYG